MTVLNLRSVLCETFCMLTSSYEVVTMHKEKSLKSNVSRIAYCMNISKTFYECNNVFYLYPIFC